MIMARTDPISGYLLARDVTFMTLVHMTLVQHPPS